MVKFTNYIETSANIVQSIHSNSPIEAGLFVYQAGDDLIVADSTTKNTMGVVLGESGITDNRIGLCHSVATQTAGVLVQREDSDKFEAGDEIFVSDNGKATTAGTISVGLASEQYKTIDGIPVVLMRAV